MTEAERDCLCNQVLMQVGYGAQRLPEQELIGSLAIGGWKYGRQFAVVGRAARGWVGGVFPSDLAVPMACAGYADAVYRSIASPYCCPMLSATGYWRGDRQRYADMLSLLRNVQAVAGALGVADTEDDCWPSHLVWSTLYKLSPMDGSVPSDALRSIQQAGCRALLELEVDIYAPRRLLFVTGLEWARPFLSDICSVAPKHHTCVEAVGELRGDHQDGRVVVATPPHGRSESAWVKEVVEAFTA